MNELKKVIKVGIADMNMVKAPESIRTSGLGSCVGLVLYDQETKKAGLLHVMLPDSGISKSEPFNHAKFADTGVDELIKKLAQEGVSVRRLKAKMAGGAQMFQFNMMRDTMRIGPRNVEAVKFQLNQFKIPLIAEDVGGNSGRTIEFDPETSKLHVRTVNQGEKVI
ncbi:chemotaxis protein CheD [Jeotgalibacillus soli]|uniref:Probable chemoreceptor glutamine deamidase CheD n=1 Tax=Jeotgalibacillus soli TaxID=889306 RepID=A0A0C2R3S3_9BACL|nr:chemotaxis protein CheD [Jeotgalibacillus soli]KIL44910.1 chemotaxis protein, stimulates methylation of MCP protein by cheR [Jeotgalibacillus soli]